MLLPGVAAKARNEVEQAFRRGQPPVAAERQHEMQVGEGEDVVVDVLFGDLGQLAPAIAHVDAAPFQPEQHGGGVLDVEIEFRRLGADLAVVEFQHAVVLPELERKQRGVPPQMLAERVAVGPGAERLLQPVDAFLQPPLHFQHVRDRVDRPQVVAA